MSGALEFSERLGEIPVYPAASSYGYDGRLTKLASNETPWSPHPAVLEAVQRELPNLNRYPDPTNSRLRGRLAERFDQPPARIAVGNGSCEILLAAAEAMLEPGAEIVYAWPSFSIYPHLAAMTGARAVTVPLDGEGRHDLKAMAAEVSAATRVAIVCNPNNPTGTTVSVERLEEFVRAVPRHVCVIVDEAYVEFRSLQDPDASLSLLRHPNVVLLRTFSKVHGLCGLRVGYALGPEEFRAAVDRVRQPFSVNALASVAATEAVGHQDEVVRRVEATLAERLHVEDGLRVLGLEAAETEANFLWVSVGERDEATVIEGLGRRGVIVRSGADLGGKGHFRVTLGTHAENERFLGALAHAVEEADRS